MTQELFIIKNGIREAVELGRSAEINLNFTSKIFGNLSKYESSFSYTFSVPASQSNKRLFSASDIIQSDSDSIWRNYSAVLVLNGVPILPSASLYVSSAVTGDSYSCNLVWNSISALSVLNDISIDINKLGNYIDDYDYAYFDEINKVTERDKLFYLGEWTKFSDFINNPSRVVGSLHKAGVNASHAKYFIENRYYNINYSRQFNTSDTPCFANFIQLGLGGEHPMVLDGTLIKGGIVTREKNGDFWPSEHPDSANISSKMYQGYYFTRLDPTYITSAGLPAPVVSVRYILDAIEKAYPGLKIDTSDTLINTLGVPMVNVSCSKGVWSKNYITFTLSNIPDNESKFMYIKSFQKHIDENCFYNDFVSKTETAKRNDSYTEYTSLFKIPQSCGRYRDDQIPSCNYGRIRVILGGYIEFEVRGIAEGAEEKCKPKISVETLIFGNKQGGDRWYSIGSLEAEFIYRGGFFGGSGTTPEVKDLPCVYRIELRPEQGHDLFESDIFYSAEDYCYIRFELSDSSSESGYFNPRQISGELKLYVRHDDISDERYVNVFQNLPEISCMDFVKSLGYITGTYPVLSDGVVRFISYNSAATHIKNNELTDWSKYLLSEDSSSAKIDFSISDVHSYAKRNYFLMKNDTVRDDGHEEENTLLEEAYEHSYGKITINNDYLDNYTTVVQLPFYGAFLRNAKAPNVETYKNQSLWTTENGLQYSLGEAKPIIAKIVPQQTKTIQYTLTGSQLNNWERTVDISESDGYECCTIEVLSFPPDMSNDDRYSFMAQVLNNPKSFQLDMVIPEAELTNMDMTKPVYLDRYNSLFMIQSIEYNSGNRISNVKLLKIPNDI